MEILKELALAFIMLIRLGAVLRIVYCFISINSDEEKVSSYKRRIKNTIIFYIMAECIWLIKDLAMSYYM